MIAGRHVVVTASVGVTVSSTADVGPQDLLYQADRAQYQAKENGRNRVEVLRRRRCTRCPVGVSIMKRRSVRPSADGQIVAYLQPQIDLRSGRIVGAEALARWNHPGSWRASSAADFVPLAEESDLILEVDAVVRRSAIEARVALGARRMRS